MIDAGAGNCMDRVSIHPYPFSEHSEFHVPYNSSATVMADKFIEAVTTVDALVRQKTGRRIPILVTEEGIIDSPAWEQRTADFLTQIYTKGKNLPFLEGIWWFALEDYSNQPYGLLRSNNTKKPAFFAFQAMAKGIPNTGPSPTGPPPPPPGPHVILTVTPACFANAELNTFALANNPDMTSPTDSSQSSLSLFDTLKQNLASVLFFWE